MASSTVIQARHRDNKPTRGRKARGDGLEIILETARVRVSPIKN